MGTRIHYAVCRVCDEKKCQASIHGTIDGSFGFSWEWYDKQDAVKVIQELCCPCCGSEDWMLTDCSEI